MSNAILTNLKLGSKESEYAANTKGSCNKTLRLPRYISDLYNYIRLTISPITVSKPY